MHGPVLENLRNCVLGGAPTSAGRRVRCCPAASRVKGEAARAAPSHTVATATPDCGDLNQGNQTWRASVTVAVFRAPTAGSPLHSAPRGSGGHVRPPPGVALLACASLLPVSTPRLYSRLYCRQGLAAFPRARLTAGLHARCSSGWNGPRPRA